MTAPSRGRTLGPDPLSWSIAWRYLRGRQSRLLSGTARAALASTALGVTAMVIAMALMTGYREDLQRKLIGGNAAVVAYPLAGSGAEAVRLEEKLPLLRAIPGVTQVSSVGYGQGSLSSPRNPAGAEVTLRGVEPGHDRFATGAALEWRPGLDLPGTVLGSELARQLEAVPGDTLRLVALGFEPAEGGAGADGSPALGLRPRFRYQNVKLTGAFTTGFSEFDSNWVLIDRALLEHLGGAATGGSRLVEFAVAEPSEAPRIAQAAERILGAHYLVTDWRELNRELFTALRLQQIALFLVLGLIVLVSTFNLASTLVVLVRERMRDIGVLAALGFTPGRLRTVFVLYGLALGALGVTIGVGLGWGAAWVLDTFELIRFGPEVAAIYFISAVPFRVDPLDVLAIVGFALLVTGLACFVPAWGAARVQPAAALRYE